MNWVVFCLILNDSFFFFVVFDSIVDSLGNILILFFPPISCFHVYEINAYSLEVEVHTRYHESSYEYLYVDHNGTFFLVLSPQRVGLRTE